MGRSALAAIVAAGLALVVAIVTLVVVVRRGAPPAPTGARVIETRATADAIVALLDEGALAPSPSLTGLVPAAPAALGLEPGDELRSLGGRALRTAGDLRLQLRAQARFEAPSLLFEVGRGDELDVVRIQIDGDLRAALAAWSEEHRPPPSDPLPDDPDLETIRGDITNLSDEHTVVQARGFALLRADPSRLTRGARVLPSYKNGVADGFKLYAIRPTSIVGALGLKNGDTVRAINGAPLTNLDDALALYQSLGDATRFELDLTRRGRPVTLTIEIR